MAEVYVNETLRKTIETADNNMVQQILRQGKLGTAGEVEIVIDYKTSIFGLVD
jgi:hypothetical protein